LHLFEFKWQANNAKMPASILQSYPINSSEIINISNYEKFIG
jgi:hypothetical protein